MKVQTPRRRRPKRRATVEQTIPADHRDSAIEQTLSHTRTLGMGVEPSEVLKSTYPEFPHPRSGDVVTQASVDPAAVADSMLQMLQQGYYLTMQDAFDGMTNPSGEHFGRWASEQQKAELAQNLRAMGFKVDFEPKKLPADSYAPPAPMGEVATPFPGKTAQTSYYHATYLTEGDKVKWSLADTRTDAIVAHGSAETEDAAKSAANEEQRTREAIEQRSANLAHYLPSEAASLRTGYEVGVAASAGVVDALAADALVEFIAALEESGVSVIHNEVQERLALASERNLWKLAAEAQARVLMRADPAFVRQATLNARTRNAFRVGVKAGVTAGLRRGMCGVCGVGYMVDTDYQGFYEAGKDNGYQAAIYGEFREGSSEEEKLQAIYEAEENARQFSPFEFLAAEMDQTEDSEAAWEAYEEGVTAGAKEGLGIVSPEDKPAASKRKVQKAGVA